MIKNFSKYKSISNDLQKLRFYLMEEVIKVQRPLDKLDVENIFEKNNICKESINFMIEALLKKRIISINNNKITYLYPVSALETKHKVKLTDGKSFFSMCAIDAMGCAVTWNQRVRINSVFEDSKEELELIVDPVDRIINFKPGGNCYVSYFDTGSQFIDFNC